MAYTLGTSANGKTIEAVLQENRGLYKIQFKEGGELPKELKGEHTDVGSAQRVANVWLALKDKQSTKRTTTSK